MVHIFKFSNALQDLGVAAAALPSGETLNIVFNFPHDERNGYRHKMHVHYNEDSIVSIKSGTKHDVSIKMNDLLGNDLIEIQIPSINVNDKPMLAPAYIESLHVLRSIRDNFIHSVSKDIQEKIGIGETMIQGGIITLFKNDYEQCCHNKSDRQNAESVLEIIRTHAQKNALTVDFI